MTPPRQLLFVIPPDTHLLDITGPAHIFYEAREYGAPLNLHFVRLLPGEKVSSSAGLHFVDLVDYRDFNLSTGDYIFLPGIGYERLSDAGFLGRCALFFDWLRRQHAAGAAVCSICTGTFLVAASGLLNGHRTTTHWKYLDIFRRTFPKVQLESGRLFVSDGNLHASAGVSSGIDLSLHILEKDFGPTFAAQIAKEVVVYLRRGEADPQLSVFLQYRNHLDDRIHRVQDAMAHRLEDSLSLADLAALVNTSSRNLTRAFKKATGTTIGAYQEQLRIERARQLLEEGQTVAAAATAVGLKSTNRLRQILKEV